MDAIERAVRKEDPNAHVVARFGHAGVHAYLRDGSEEFSRSPQHEGVAVLYKVGGMCHFGLVKDGSLQMSEKLINAQTQCEGKKLTMLVGRTAVGDRRMFQVQLTESLEALKLKEAVQRHAEDPPAPPPIPTGSDTVAPPPPIPLGGSDGVFSARGGGAATGGVEPPPVIPTPGSVASATSRPRQWGGDSARELPKGAPPPVVTPTTVGFGGGAAQQQQRGGGGGGGGGDAAFPSTPKAPPSVPPPPVVPTGGGIFSNTSSTAGKPAASPSVSSRVGSEAGLSVALPTYEGGRWNSGPDIKDLRLALIKVAMSDEVPVRTLEQMLQTYRRIHG